MLAIWTVGHSNVKADVLLAALRTGGIERLVDVRMFPQSRRNPQFNRDALTRTLAAEGIEYQHMPSLGGRRLPRDDSTNLGLKDEGFRGFADFMQTPEFELALIELLDVTVGGRTAIMCAEALPWKCHRSLISDALTARGVEVWHLFGGSEHEHVLTAGAKVEREAVSYPSLL